MSDRYFSVVTSKDNFIANIRNEEEAIEFGKIEGNLEPAYVRSLLGSALILENVAMLLPNGNNVGVLPFKDLAFGSEFVTIPVSAVTEIYLIQPKFAIQVRAAIAGIEISK